MRLLAGAGLASGILEEGTYAIAYGGVASSNCTEQATTGDCFVCRALTVLPEPHAAATAAIANFSAQQLPQSSA